MSVDDFSLTSSTLHGPVRATAQAPTAVGLTRVESGARSAAAPAWPAVLAAGLAAGARQHLDRALRRPR